MTSQHTFTTKPSENRSKRLQMAYRTNCKTIPQEEESTPTNHLRSELVQRADNKPTSLRGRGHGLKGSDKENSNNMRENKENINLNNEARDSSSQEDVKISALNEKETYQGLKDLKENIDDTNKEGQSRSKDLADFDVKANNLKEREEENIPTTISLFNTSENNQMKKANENLEVQENSIKNQDNEQASSQFFESSPISTSLSGNTDDKKGHRHGKKELFDNISPINIPDCSSLLVSRFCSDSDLFDTTEESPIAVDEDTPNYEFRELLPVDSRTDELNEAKSCVKLDDDDDSKKDLSTDYSIEFEAPDEKEKRIIPEDDGMILKHLEDDC